MKKSAFTLIELAIVISIIGIILVMVVEFGTTTLEKKKFSTTQNDLKNIHSSLLSYAVTYGRFPYPDTDGDGYENIGVDCTTQTCELPYFDLSIKSKDSFGQRYIYDVWDQLLVTNKDNLCHTMRNHYTGNISPTVVNDHKGTTNEKSYSVAAVVISKGADKKLTGENVLGDRVYEMSQNEFDTNSNNDLVMELSILDFLSNACDLRPDNTKGKEIDASLDVNNTKELHNGNVIGGVVFNTVGALSYTTYDGTGNQYIQYDLNKTYPRFTFSMWLNLNDWNNPTRQFFWSGETDELRLEITNGAIIYRPAPIGSGDYMNMDLGLDGSGWHFITFTQRRTSSTNVEASFYVDGILRSRVNGNWADLNNTFYIGSWAGRGADGLLGSIDNLKFYDYDRLESDIASYFNSTKAEYGF